MRAARQQPGTVATAVPTLATDMRHPAARFREPELRRLFRFRYVDRLPADDTGRRAAARMLEAIALSGPDGSVRAENFLVLCCPWMARSERAEITAAAFEAPPYLWSAQLLGDNLGLTWEERDACRITTIRPAGATDDELAERRKMKAVERMREKRRRADLSPAKKAPKPKLRAEAIASVIRPGERIAVAALCEHLRRTKPIHFVLFIKDQGRLKAVVHDAIKAGVSLGLLRKEVEVGAHGLPIAWVSRAGEPS